MVKPLHFFAYTVMSVFVLTELSRASEDGDHPGTPSSVSRKRLRENESSLLNTPRNSPSQKNGEDDLNDFSDYSNEEANPVAVRLIRTPLAPLRQPAGNRLPFVVDDLLHRGRLFLPEVLPRPHMPQRLHNIAQLQTMCQLNGERLNSNIGRMNQECARFQQMANIFFLGNYRGTDILHPSAQTLEDTCHAARAHLAQYQRRIVTRYELNRDPIPTEAILNVAQPINNEYNIHRQPEDNRIGARLTTLFLEYQTIKLWIKSYFEQATQEHEQGMGNILQYQLPETSTGFSQILETLDSTFIAARLIQEEAFVIRPNNHGDNAGEVIEFQTAWRSLFPNAEQVIKSYINTLRNTFVTYLYSTGSGSHQIDLDLNFLSFPNSAPNNHCFGKMENLERLDKFMDLINKTCTPAAVGQHLVNRRQLTQQILAYYDLGFPNLARDEDLRRMVKNGLCSISEDKKDQYWTLLLNENTGLGSYISKELYTGDALKEAEIIYDAGRRLLLLHDLLTAFTNEPEYTDIFFRSIEVLNQWKARLDEFRKRHPKSSLPIRLKTSRDYSGPE